MRARYLLLVAVVAAGLFTTMAIRSAQGEVRSAQGQAGRTLTFRAPRPRRATTITWTCRRTASRWVTGTSGR
jgi:hypothetical protein